MFGRTSEPLSLVRTLQAYEGLVRAAPFPGRDARLAMFTLFSHQEKQQPSGSGTTIYTKRSDIFL